MNAVIRVGILATLTAASLDARQVTFRGGVELVSVDVSVRQGARSVGDLRIADFEVRDNGVLQPLDSVVFEAVPIEVTLVVDLSQSVEGQLFRSIAQAVASVQRQLRSDDRINLVRFDREIREVAVGADARLDLQALLGQPQGRTALFDAMTAALIRPTNPGYRQMTIVLTDGVDTESVLGDHTVREIAKRTEAAISVVAVTRGGSVPHRAFFEGITDTTGGLLLIVDQGLDVDSAFGRAFTEHRASYLVRYSRTGVASPGWHDISVRVMRPGKFDVRARRGYWAR